MNKFVTFVIALWCFSLTTCEASADFIVRGNGLIYDNDLNVTWLQNADLFNTGLRARSWDEAVALVSSLSYQGFNDWRLPRTPGSGIGFLNEGELGHLYYPELGNVAGGIGFNTGPFVNIQRGRYWTETPSGVDSAFSFYIAENVPNSGFQDTDLKNHGNNIWVLRDGDVVTTAVPEPRSIVLFSIGLVWIAMSGYRRKNVQARI